MAKGHTSDRVGRPGSSSSSSRSANTVFTGEEWQCVEFGRRFWLRVYQAAFASIPGAVDIFPLTTVDRYSLRPAATTPSTTVTDFNDATVSATGDTEDCECHRSSAAMGTIPNNTTNTTIQVGDLVIYNSNVGPDIPYGHVAAVVEVIFESEIVGSISGGVGATTGGTTVGGKHSHHHRVRLTENELKELKMEKEKVMLRLGSSTAKVVAYVRIGEENWDFNPWSSSSNAEIQSEPRHYSRTLLFVQDEVTKVRNLVNPPWQILGMKRLSWS